MRRLLKHHRLLLVTAAAACAWLGAGCASAPRASPSPVNLQPLPSLAQVGMAHARRRRRSSVNLQPLPSPQARRRITSEEIWHEDFTWARAIAEQKGHLMLLDFTGSDWCRWCIKLKSEVFKTDTFRNWANERQATALISR